MLGEHADLAGLTRRLATLAPAERRQLEQAIERQRGHFTSKSAPLHLANERSAASLAGGDRHPGAGPRRRTPGSRTESAARGYAGFVLG